MGTIRGGQLALGKGGRIHVVCFGSAQAGVRCPGDTAPLLYTRLNDQGTACEPQRNLMTRTTHLDGGPSVAADGTGTVTVAWHANETGSDAETRRGLFLARSGDERADRRLRLLQHQGALGPQPRKGSSYGLI